MKKVLVIGGSGMVASRFIDLVRTRFEIVASDEKTCDITNWEAVNSYFSKNNFDAVINFAAFTNVDAAEAQNGDTEGLAWKINVKGPENLARICNDKNIFLVHISTDFVFPGSEVNPGPYDEDAKLPEKQEGIGWYGWTKNRAEDITNKISNKYAIVRYGYPFRAAAYDAKRDWARNLINLYNEKKLYPLFDDQIQSVIFIDDLVEPLVKIINEKLTGIFHIVSSNTTTPYEIGSYLLEKYADKPVEIQKGSMIEFLKSPGRTPRPRLGGLRVGNTEAKLGIKFRTWQQMVDEFINQIKTQKNE